MSTHEEVSEIKSTHERPIPRGYRVTYHELRGYDSPDRWYEASTIRGRGLGSFVSLDDARAACRADAKKRKRKSR